MNKRIIIVIIVLSAIICLLVAGLMASTHKESPAPSGQSTEAFPSAPASDTTNTATNGQSDLLNNPNVHQDEYNQGYYYIGTGLSEDSASDNPPYTIRYIAATKYFNIAILQEPIGETRKEAEAYLTQQLGLTEEQMCALNYAVYVPNDVNAQYSGMNLGFSFCPGAIPLP